MPASTSSEATSLRPAPAVRRCFTVLCFLALAAPLTAQVIYTGPGGTTGAPLAGTWNSAANWSPNGVPASANTTQLTFGGFSYTATNDIPSAPFTLNRLTFTTAGTVTLAGSALALDGTSASILHNGDGDVVISNDVSLLTTVELGGSGEGFATLSGLISGTGGLAVTGGDFTLSGAEFAGTNTFTGTTTVSGGTLRLEKEDGGAISGALVISGGRVQTTGYYQLLSGFDGESNFFGQSVTLNGGTFEIGGVEDFASFSGTGGTLNLGNSGDISVRQSGDTTFSGTIAGPNGLFCFDGTGSLTLAGTTDNTVYTTLLCDGLLIFAKTGGAQAVTGDLFVSAGTVRLGGSNQISDSSQVILAGDSTVPAVLDLNGYNETIGILVSVGTDNAITLGSGTLTVREGAYAGPISGSGVLRKTTSGDFFLSGENTYTGGTILTAGNLIINADNVLPDTGTFTFNGGTLHLFQFSDTIGPLQLSTGSILDFGSSETSTANSLTFGASNGLTWNGTLTVFNFDTALDSLRFGNSSSGLTAGQLASITFDGFTAGAQIDSSGFVTPLTAVPEPSTYAALAGLSALGLACWRRRRASS